MEKSSNKTRKSLIVVLYIILVIAISYITINNYLKLKDINKKNISLKKEYKPLEQEYKELTNSNKTIIDQVNMLKDVDNKILSTKEDVFKKASDLEKKIQNKESSYKIAYLTFDDGPYYQPYKLLDLLKEKQIKVTFFTIGAGKTSCIDKRSEDCTNLYKLEVDSGHTVANHTYSHSIFNGLYSSVDEFMRQVDKQEQLIYEKTGIKTNIIRFPGGSVTAGRLKDDISKKLKEKGYGWVDWTCEDGDGRDLSSESQAWNILKSTMKNDIEVILMHDYDETTFSILPEFIDYLEDNNYIILPLFYDSVMINK